MASIAALLLAAGESTRMVELKALLPWHGEALLEYQVAALSSAGLIRTMVVLGFQSERLKAVLKGHGGVQHTHNPDYQEGKTTSIKAGLRALGQVKDSSGLEDAVLILNVDQPRSANIIQRVMELHLCPSGGPSGPTYLITVPTYQGKGGHPIIVSTSLIAEIMDISEDTLGLKAVVYKHKIETQRVEIDSPEILLDLNTPQEYRNALDTLALEQI